MTDGKWINPMPRFDPDSMIPIKGEGQLADRPKPKIRVTRRVAPVPGSYGRVRVDYDPDIGHIVLNWSDRNGNQAMGVVLSAEELREAAHILVQLAEMVEDNDKAEAGHEK